LHLYQNTPTRNQHEKRAILKSQTLEKSITVQQLGRERALKKNIPRKQQLGMRRTGKYLGLDGDSPGTEPMELSQGVNRQRNARGTGSATQATV
jgi:hypothetical protein